MGNVDEPQRAKWWFSILGQALVVGVVYALVWWCVAAVWFASDPTAITAGIVTSGAYVLGRWHAR